jgi:hypothetical protein
MAIAPSVTFDIRTWSGTDLMGCDRSARPTSRDLQCIARWKGILKLSIQLKIELTPCPFLVLRIFP